MNLYYIQEGYIDFLRRYDNKVAENKAESRPYVGVIMKIDDMKYYAPLSSPKKKHRYMKNSKDFRRIGGGEYGAINFNNMIPIVDQAIIEFNIEDIKDKKYRRMLQNQHVLLKKDSRGIERTARNLRMLIFADDKNLTKNDIKIKMRCCNLVLLEKVYRGYLGE